MTFERKAFDDFLLENGCIEFYNPPLMAGSGRLGWWEANIRKLLKSIPLKRRLAEFLYSFMMLRDLKPDFFLGVPEGAIPLGESVNDLINYRDLSQVPATILRSEYKRYGDPRYRYSVGPLEKGNRVVLIDDTISTGDSFMKYTYVFKQVGVIIDEVVVCVDRLERRSDGKTAGEILREYYHIGYSSLTDASTLLPRACELLKPDRTILENIENDFKRHGAREIGLL